LRISTVPPASTVLKLCLERRMPLQTLAPLESTFIVPSTIVLSSTFAAESTAIPIDAWAAQSEVVAPSGDGSVETDDSGSSVSLLVTWIVMLMLVVIACLSGYLVYRVRGRKRVREVKRYDIHEKMPFARRASKQAKVWLRHQLHSRGPTEGRWMKRIA
jgi:hypothetical protein